MLIMIIMMIGEETGGTKDVLSTLLSMPRTLLSYMSIFSELLSIMAGP